MKVQKQIEVRLSKKRVIAPVDVVQYDTGIQLVFSVADFTLPSETTATLYIQKKSGKFVYQENGITVSGNDITVDLENQALTEYGEAKYQLQLKNGTDVVTTFAGVLRVEKSLADSGAEESKTVISAFDELTAEQLVEFQTKAEQIVQACIATIPEDYTVMEAKVNELANAVKGSLSGAVVRADDVSPVEHNPEVWIHGKNLLDNTNLETVITNYGSGETIDTGVRATVTSAGTWRYALFKLLPIEKLIGKTVTLSWTASASGANTPRVAIGYVDPGGHNRIQKEESINYSDSLTMTVGNEYTGLCEYVAF